MELTNKEKLSVLESTFPYTENNNINDKRLIKNVGDLISENFSKIDGFDFRWSSLITSNPLLFEDIEYLRIKPFVNNTITEQEIEAYRRGELRDLYATFDSMLVCNLQYYDRIMSFCTMIFLQYVRVDGQQYNEAIEDIIELELTPTKIWCCALTSTLSTEFELNYAWGKGKKITSKPIEGSNKSVLEVSWKNLYRNRQFNKFVEYSSLRVGVDGFRQAFLADKTSNSKLSIVCSKFTKTSTAISSKQLETVHEYFMYQNEISDDLYLILNQSLNVMFAGDEKQYCVFVFSDEFHILTSKFSMRVFRDSKGKISKDYIANSHECFIAESYLSDTIKQQIKWSKSYTDSRFNYDKDILKTILFNMLSEDFRKVICIKRMNEYGILTKIYFKGMFANVQIIEEYIFNNKTIKTTTKTLSKKNASNYVIDRGYVIFGLEEDVFKLNYKPTRIELESHFLNYCIPVLQHLTDIILLHQTSKNDIIDFVVHDKLNPNKIKNHKILDTDLRTDNEQNLDGRNLLSDIKNMSQSNNNKTYWKAISDD